MGDGCWVPGRVEGGNEGRDEGRYGKGRRGHVILLESGNL